MKNLLNRSRGQVAVEFALVGIVLFMMVIASVEAGRAVWHYNTLAQATREGTRYAIVHGAKSSDPSGPGSAHFTSPDYDSKVAETVTRNAPGLDPDHLTIEAEWPDGAAAIGDRVKVTTNYEFEPIIGFFSGLAFTMSSSSTMEITH